MPNKRKRDVPAVPDITEDPAERKRVLGVLAQRRYRERKRQQWQTLQGRAENRSGSEDGQTQVGDASLPLKAGVETRTTLDSTGDSVSQSVSQTMEDISFNTDGPWAVPSQIMPELSDQSMDLIPDALSPSQFLSFPQSPLLPVVPAQDMTTMPVSAAENRFSYFSPTAFFPALLPSFASTQSANIPGGDCSLSDRLQTYQSATFSFPDDHLLDIPSLTLLNAAMKVAQRLNIAGILWDLTATSPFYQGPESQAISSPPSLSSGASSPSSTQFSLNGADDAIELPRHLQPTISQRLIPHHPILDLLPWPSTRDKLIQVFHLPPEMRPKSAQDPIGLLRFVYDMEDVSGEGIKVRGGDPFAPQAWEVGQVVFERWWWAFDGQIVERSNWVSSKVFLFGLLPLNLIKYLSYLLLPFFCIPLTKSVFTSSKIMLASQLLLSLAAAGLVSAQNTVTSMLIYGADPQPLVASIVGSDATATTYSINCPPGTDSSDCGMGPGLTVVAGPTTTVLKMDEPEEDLCSVGGTTTAACTETASGTGANFPDVSSSTFSNDLPLMAVTITAGAAGASATPATASAAATTAATTSASGKSTASKDSSKTSSSGSSAVSTGGMPRVTGGAGGLLGAAAVALGVFAL
ncbi:hypothetical protein Aspvir_008451 [Aspergillus viridinutans]|uniref:BZIP domain-containing protein n=1 Tax=Aspergillus viridinutans TaxID=75553 RepID=A0A9P3BWQ9_ASPVI|nr:uncharacterized protein Aspvir_008451 [Aspergillus viridinutans]GIK04370.1 hypothetical protein Aspvir_008451 [Aspergillus viridinutans]